MKLFLVLTVLILLDLANCKRITTRPKQNNSGTIEYLTKQNHSINIDIMIHMDPSLTAKLARHYGSRTRKKLKELSHNILMEVERFYQHPSLNQTIRFNLIDTRFIRNNNVVRVDEDGSRYLKSYCDWQSKKKFSMRRWYYSVLLTGLDLFYVNSRGEEVRRSTGRSYMSSMCNMKKSCTLIEWHPKNTGFLLAHEIAHGLSVTHDEPPSNHCRGNHIMSTKYNDRSHPNTWSECSQKSLKRYLQSDRSWCLKTERKL